MKRECTVAETRNGLTKLLRQVEAGDHVHITRRGKAVAVLISERDFERTGARRQGFMDALSEFREKWGDEPLIDDDFLDGLRDPSPGREVEL